MVEKQQVSYPQMSANNWWALRKRFVQSMPASVTASYLSAVLPMTERSATNNLLRPLKKIGLVDQDNKPTERAYKWRDDDQYREACEEIRKDVYPQELLDAFSGSDLERPAVERWFRNNARVGENAASKLATFYLLLVDSDPSQQDKNTSSGQRSEEGSNQKSRTRTTRVDKKARTPRVQRIPHL